ncbi:septum site-determining protein MinC [Thauera sp.]|uniref:septum site-determining protein MinC n=1 Tax=Thauera sp. TaxID=1905334 RepID=UPI002586804D|nr:septum site-determining protein MinC [Thauera sp.]HNR61890.1 septum site-determining protein MinC [Thauera sp.]HNS91878.1 septum site-determining protein MinC [Thauera sp.]
MPAPARPIEFRNTTLGATVAVLQAAEPTVLADALHKMLGGMPDFFNGEAVVLDFGSLRDGPERIDWAGLQSLLRRYRLQPIGTCRLAEHHHAGARQAGLALLDAALLPERPAAEPVRQPEPAAAPASQPAAQPAASPSPAPTLFVDRPLRSGQQVYARGADLVLLGGVSPGAEVIADGSIHCYGPLRGRAIAGAQGDHSARIMSSNFGPELVSISGVFRTFERGIPESIAGRPAMVRLTGSDHQLNIDALQLG